MVCGLLVLLARCTGCVIVSFCGFRNKRKGGQDRFVIVIMVAPFTGIGTIRSTLYSLLETLCAAIFEVPTLDLYIRMTAPKIKPLPPVSVQFVSDLSLHISLPAS